MTAGASDDSALVERFRAAAGVERDAIFERIFVDHRQRVYRLCLRLCGERSIAEDALQEVFLEVHKGLAQFRGDSQLATWIYRIAVRTALRTRAHYSDRRPRVHPTPPPTTDPSVVLTARADARAVQVALDQLPAEQRAVVAMFSVDGFSHAQIAEILGIPEGTVWSRLHKGRKALALALVD